jgi:hypothetical protein
MKKSLFLVLVACLYGHSFLAQHRLFDNLLPANQLSSQVKLGNDYASTFSQVFYYQQDSFNLNQDLILSLPNNQEIIAQFDKIYNYKNGSFSVFYKILGQPDAELVFSSYNDAITGMYTGQNLEKLIFQKTAPNIMAVGIVNELKLIEEEMSSPCISVDDFQTRATNHANICLESSTCTGASVIDVMFVYTPAVLAQTAWSNVNTVNSRIASIVSNLNQSMTLSGITGVTFNIAHIYQASYTESGDHQTDLNRLSSTNDGFMDEIHALRNTHGADLVAMIVAGTGSGCGIGNLNTSTTNYSSNQAFSVTKFNCAVENFTVAHEMGHNMGLRHDWFVDGGTTPCSHHHGYVNQTAINLGTSSTTAQRWRTIMSYNDQCVNAGISCTRQNRWSNPELTFQGNIMGAPLSASEPAHEAFAFRRMACVVAGFKSPLKTDSFAQSAVSIYPNPANNVLNIDTLLENPIFEIFNTLGQKLLQTTDKNINIDNLQSGVYYLNVKSESESGQKVYKFIKA